MPLLQMFAGRAVSNQVWWGVLISVRQIRVRRSPRSRCNFSGCDPCACLAGVSSECANGARATLLVQKEFAHGGPCPCSCSTAQAIQCSWMWMCCPGSKASWAFKLVLLSWQRLWKKCKTTLWCWTVLCFSNWFSLCWHRNPLWGRLFSAGMGLSSLVQFYNLLENLSMKARHQFLPHSWDFSRNPAVTIKREKMEL